MVTVALTASWGRSAYLAVAVGAMQDQCRRDTTLTCWYTLLAGREGNVSVVCGVGFCQ